MSSAAIPSNSEQFGGFAGMAVNDRTAMQHLAVYACVRLLADSIASLPVDVYRKSKGSNVRVPLETPPVLVDPDTDINDFEYMQQVVTSLALRGNSIEYITSYDNLERPASRIPIHPDEVQITRNRETGKPEYRINNDPIKDVKRIIHIRRLTLPGQVEGLSPIRQAAQAIGMGLAAERFGARWFADSANPSAILRTDANVDDDEMTRIQKTWVATHGGRRMPAILSGGLDYKPISITPEESQFLQCVVAGTLVTMADGTRRPVEDLVPGDSVMAWNGSKLEAAPVASVGAPPVKPLARIKTARGRELTATTDHPVLAMQSLRTPGRRPIDNGGDWVRLGDLKVGQYVRVALGSLPALDNGMTADEAYFLGAMVGDGHIRASGFQWASAVASVTARMASAVESLGGSLRHRDGCNFDVRTGGVGRGSSRIRALLNDAGLIGSHSHDKFVPESVVSGGPVAWRAFLSGYFDADGSIRDREGEQKPAAYWASTSRGLLDGCQHLLALLGIQSAVYQMKPGGTRIVMGQECATRPSWGLYVMGLSQLGLLADELDIAHGEKRRRLSGYKGIGPSRYRSVNFEFDRITEVEFLGEGETVGVEIENLHTHVTGGIITHNTRDFQRSEIAMFFGIPPHMIGDTTKATSWGSGIEQLGIGFVKYSLMPWLRCIESTYSRMLLPRGQYMRFNVDALLRGDTISRYSAYTQARNAGWLSVNEIRAKEDMLPIENGDDFLQPLNMGILGETPAPAPSIDEGDPDAQS